MTESKRYKLENLDLGTELILDNKQDNVFPKDWDNNEFTFKKSLKNFTESRKYSKNIQFVKNAKLFLDEAYNNKFVEANVKLTEERLNKYGGYDTFVTGYLDFESYVKQKNQSSAPFDVGGLQNIVKSKQSEKFELERTTDLNDNEIDHISHVNTNLVNRPLDRNSKLSKKDDPDLNKYDEISYNIASTANTKGSCSIPLKIEFESDDFVSGVEKFSQTTLNDIKGSESTFFYNRNDSNKILNCSIKGSCVAGNKQMNNLVSAKANLVIYVYNINDLSSPIREIYKSQDYDVLNNQDVNISLDSLFNIEINKDECLFLGIVFEGSNVPLEIGKFSMFVKDIDFTIKIQETSTENDISRETKVYLK